jgi:hypothetical protein
VPKDRYEFDGQGWLSIQRAAKLLGTNSQAIRKLMSEGKLEWRQTRANSRTFVVEEKAVLALRQERPAGKLIRSPDPLAKPPRPEPFRREGGGLWEAHHLRLTLPVADATKKKP